MQQQEQRQFVLEAATNNVQESLEAEQKGANRIELCSRLDIGGLSPSKEEILEAQSKLKIPISVMIRPRAGDFVYNEKEIEEMKDLITFCRENGVYGVVYGTLDKDSNFDQALCQQLVDVSQGLSITFHRAFDEVKNPLDTLEKLISMGVNRLLTSGQQPKATEGIDMIRQCIEVSKGRITIMPGSGVNKDNLEHFKKELNTSEFHGTKIV